MVKVDIVSGFLGSGKTTFIKRLLEENVLNEKVIIVENDFGKASIDGHILQESGFEIVEVNSGCICCSLVGEFSKAMQSIVETYQPERIIIEPSGVGKLSQVISSCQESPLKDQVRVNSVITIVDILNYKANLTYVTEYFEDQIRHANTVFLTRTERTHAEEIEHVSKDIKRINEKANIVVTPLSQLKGTRILELLENRVGSLLEDTTEECLDPHCSCHHGDHEHHHHEHHHDHHAENDFQVWETETVHSYTATEIKNGLKALNDASFGKVFRAKGIVQSDDEKWLQFDFVPQEYSIKEISPDYIGRVSVIGKDLNTSKIGQLFNV